MLLTKESVSSLKENPTQYRFSYFQIACNIFNDWPIKYYFWRFQNM